MKRGEHMKMKRLLLAVSVCMMLFVSPVTGQKSLAVKVDIKDNYDAGLLEEDKDTKAEAKRQAEEDAAESATSASSGTSNAANTASSAASSAGAASSTAASTASSTASSAASTASTVTPVSTASTTASTAQNDLPKTGDDDRIMITGTVMLASLAVFLTTLFAGKFGKNV